MNNKSFFSWGRWLKTAAVLVAVTANTAFAESKAWPKEVSLGYQKYGSLIILKSTGNLEKRLQEKGVAVKWAEFQFGPPMLEALNAGSLDFAITGETPPVFAQAAKGSPLVYVANEPASPQGEGLLVKADSGVKTVADLKGKKVATAKGSNAHYFLIQALAKAGLTLNDVNLIFLAPADARAALERGDVSAWSIWDYFYAAAELQLGTRTLTDGEGIVNNYAFYTSRREVAEKYPELIAIILEEVGKTDAWIKDNPAAAAEQLAVNVGVDAKILEKALHRSNYGPEPIKPEVAAAQQKIADTLLDIKLLPHAISVGDAVWQRK
ncbi:sulfonate ABC transporter substrate-binding protein [Candidatus Methylobacter oryzae]|uniref:Sulfonate ABC transporter substrate-binding protein n=1 Tax=Candidatus Methylobacter oryzae TaxID=2497749 RepID=A0ABY3CCT2_9GAMM|nr:sulfonate ABC transporter substrate-binding protein [Candidatus Methylobacter oryzae]TRW99993.1 sulfonate ABC transporter substrate-binding protein [Candidatus Methylobacter oryzae]